MDTTKAITHVSLCAGYGGIDLGLKRAIPNLRTIAFSEIEAFACANLVSKMEAGLLDAAPIWTNLKTFPWEDFRDRVDILSGGYPCQPFSAAGKRLGAEDPRHLWPHISAGIALMRPSVCFFENVEGHISLGLPDVIEDLAGLGYRTTWGIFSASEVGAPHQRKRVFILARDTDRGWQPRHTVNTEDKFYRDAEQHARETAVKRASAELADSQRAGLEGFWTDPRQSTESELRDCGGEGCGELADASSNGHNGRELQDGVDRWQGGQLPQPQRGESSSLWGKTVGCSQAWPSRPGELADSHSDQPSAQRGNDGQVRSLSEAQRQPEHSAAVFGGGCLAGGTAWPSRPGEPQHWWEPPRVVGNAEHAGLNAAEITGSTGKESKEGRVQESAGGCGVSGNDSNVQRAEYGGVVNGNGNNVMSEREDSEQRKIITTSRTGAEGWRQAESTLGRDANGPSHRLDDAELYVSCDNRTDELRLLGNGVVPATAHKAFITLWKELND